MSKYGTEPDVISKKISAELAQALRLKPSLPCFKRGLIYFDFKKNRIAIAPAPELVA